MGYIQSYLCYKLQLQSIISICMGIFSACLCKSASASASVQLPYVCAVGECAQLSAASSSQIVELLRGTNTVALDSTRHSLVGRNWHFKDEICFGDLSWRWRDRGMWFPHSDLYLGHGATWISGRQRGGARSQLGFVKIVIEIKPLSQFCGLRIGMLTIIEDMPPKNA